MEDVKGGYFLLWKIAHVFLVINQDTLKHNVRQGLSASTSKRCIKWEDYIKQANGKDNPSPGTQIISMATVMHAIILDINLFNVNYVQKAA